MPNSVWTDSGNSVDVTIKTTSIDTSATAGSADYLSNADKISLMSSYGYELATKTQLGQTVSSLNVSTTDYDNAVAAIGTALITAGAPTNWATTWPDGTTSGPWTGIKTSLANLWAQVATQRTALQAAISAAQAAAAQVEAISAAATDATTKANAAFSNAQAYADTAKAAAIASAANDAKAKADAAQAAAVATAAKGTANGITGATLYYRAPDYSSLALNGTIVDDSANGASMGKVSTFTEGWALQQQISGYAGFGIGSYDLYIRIRSNGQGNFPTLVYAGVYDWNSQTYYFNKTLGLSDTYAEVYMGRVTLNSQNIKHGIVTFFSASGVTTQYYVDYIKCVPTVNGTNIAANTITADLIAAGAITAPAIAAGAVTANSLTVANFDNLIPNPNSEQAAPAGGWPSGAYEAVGLTTTASARAGSRCRSFRADTFLTLTAPIPCSAGDQFLFQGWGLVSAASLSSFYFYIRFLTASGSVAQDVAGSATFNWSEYTQFSNSGVAPTGAAFVQFIVGGNEPSGGHTFFVDDLYARRMADASLIVDGAITADKIAVGSVTANAIATDAVTATAIAAGAVTANSLTVANFDNLIPNPNSAMTTPQGTSWKAGTYEASGLTSVGVYPLTPQGGCRVIAGTGALSLIDLVNNIPVNPGDMFYFECYAASNDDHGSKYVQVSYRGKDDSYLADYGTNALTSVIGLDSANPAKLSATLPAAPPGAATIHVWLVNNGGTNGSMTFFNRFYLRRMADASLIVDGSITANKIAAGSITADMIKTGTLDANVVDITNLNASNITTGTMSASKVLFPDGSSLQTAARVVTTVINGTATNTTVSGGATATLAGLSYTAVASSSNDVFNFFGNYAAKQSSGITSDAMVMGVKVDGGSSYADSCNLFFGTIGPLQNGSIVLSVTGLSAGSHSFQFYITGSNVSNDTFIMTGGTKVTCQHIY